MNLTNIGFQKALNSPIYVDKTGMIEKLNRMIGTNEPMLCVSRPRRFGKSMAVNMLTAYYSKGCHSEKLFTDCIIKKASDFNKYLNKYDVIRMDMQWMMGNAVDAQKRNSSVHIIRYIQEEVIRELEEAFPAITDLQEGSMAEAMMRINVRYGTQFIVLIDEWDAVFRNFKENQQLQKEYIEFLRGLFKGVVAEECIALAYITGILPLKKYGTESALNNFGEYTMVNPKWMAEYMGFTEKEVMALSSRYDIDFQEVRIWYDGYRLKGAGDIYSPRSVIETMLNGEFGSHWTGTETYEALKGYIMMDFDGLKSAVSRLIAGDRISVNTERFQNDMVSMNSRDDVLSLLIHLGYLGYDEETRAVFIPNEEVKKEFENAIGDTGWTELIETLSGSQALLESTWAKNAKAAICQIKEKHYVQALKDYDGRILLVGINYDKKSKKHECIIEEYLK